ncbi:hypothetical protein KAJ83_03335 [Marivibrio halodurans]|uniref:Phytanoyl-CoA dioxygenase (PhyH) n=1 Tax=Marivibrio halodurans TaxID=2039722 RepID=A0A8J7SL77_9PROT|nr:hypothetical protein [Marivibrio halodurans]MBP5856026.1 hypothetical protein [Marivibrio halodurans]
MPDPVDLAHGMPPERLQARIFAGDILVFRGLAPVRALVSQADRMIRAHFANPEQATRHMDPASFLQAAGALRRAYGRSAEVSCLWREALAACGLVMDRTYWDRRRLRVNPSGARHHGPQVANLPAHRDSWGANLPQQINWWAPVYPVTAGRSLLIHLDAWARPVENDSATWDIEEFRRRRAAGHGAGYPPLPTATRPADWGEATPILPRPGDLIAFSAAHLHASAVNRTGRTRFNIEGRTLDLAEWRAGRGAPTPDGAAPHVALRWFSHCETGTPLETAQEQ